MDQLLIVDVPESMDEGRAGLALDSVGVLHVIIDESTSDLAALLVDAGDHLAALEFPDRKSTRLNSSHYS